MNLLHSTLDRVRDTWAPITHTSTFRSTGEITPADFVLAGDYLVYKFPSWQWADAEPSKRVSYLPVGKQYLVTKGVPCHRRLEEYQGGLGRGEMVVESGKGDGEGWLRTGGEGDGGVGEGGRRGDGGDVRTVDEMGVMEETGELDEDEIPDMEDEEDDKEAIIRDTHSSTNSTLRTYTLYITYTPYYRTPRLYLSGYGPSSQPLPPAQMMDDIVGDYKDKTVTLEDFPFFPAGVKCASVHPCRHASVMKVLLDRAEGALKRRREKIRNGTVKAGEAQGLEGLVDSTKNLSVKDSKKKVDKEDEWEVVSDNDEKESDEVAIRVDQYLVVFLKFISSVTPTIEHDFTMGI